MALSKPSEYAGASFFKPKDHQTDIALLIEPKSIERNVPSTYKGVTRNRDEVLADITVFSNQAALDKGEPTGELKNTKVTHGMLTSTLEKILGGAMAGVVTKIPTQAGEGYVFRDVSPEDEAKVEAYIEAREKAVEEALANTPDFD